MLGRRQAEADAVAQRDAEHEVGAVALLVEDASMPSGDSSRTPLAAPPHAIGVWTSATDRALPWPPAAGISARRHGIVADDLRRRAAG